MLQIKCVSEKRNAFRLSAKARIETFFHVSMKFTAKTQTQSNGKALYCVFFSLMQTTHISKETWIMEILIGIPDANCNNTHNRKTY